MSMEEIFGEAIYTYTRKQAIEDGVLVDVSEVEGAQLYKHPVSFSRALYERLRKGAGSEPMTFDARVWDVCWMSSCAAKGGYRHPGDTDVFFKVIVGNETLSLWGNCGPDDQGMPVMTFGFPEDR